MSERLSGDDVCAYVCRGIDVGRHVCRRGHMFGRMQLCACRCVQALCIYAYDICAEGFRVNSILSSDGTCFLRYHMCTDGFRAKSGRVGGWGAVQPVETVCFSVCAVFVVLNVAVLTYFAMMFAKTPTKSQANPGAHPAPVSDTSIRRVVSLKLWRTCFGDRNDDAKRVHRTITS